AAELLATARRRALSAGAQSREWGEARRQKQKAVESEDFAKAGELKRRQDALEGAVDVDAELCRLAESKRKAAEEEDFGLASELKTRERHLREVLASLSTSAAETAAALSREAAALLRPPARLPEALRAAAARPARGGGPALLEAVAADLASEVPAPGLAAGLP
ncbi:unnamed protein product, partial [Prorocentrum cordatum]